MRESKYENWFARLITPCLTLKATLSNRSVDVRPVATVLRGSRSLRDLSSLRSSTKECDSYKIARIIGAAEILHEVEVEVSPTLFQHEGRSIS
jgi:hypothetical protein